MKPKMWQFGFMLGCFFLSACLSGNKLKVTKNFNDEIELQQNLVFSFNKDIYPDSLLQLWDSTAYLEFTPKIKGSFKWNSSSELMFSPSEPFSPETEYKAVMSNKVLKRSKRKYQLDIADFAFHTAPLRVNSANLQWTRGQSIANVMVQLDLMFNYKVNVADAAAKIKLSSGGNSIMTTTLNEGSGYTVSLQFAPLNELDQETPLKIEVATGINLIESSKASKKDTTISTSIPSRYNLEVTGINSQHTGTEGIITVNTSQPIDGDNLKSLIQIEPAIAFDITPSDEGFIISSKAFSATQTYSLTVSKKMEGSFGGKMKADYTSPITFGQLDPAIHFSNGKGMYLSSQGFKNLSLSIVSVPQIEVNVVKIYENNIEAFFRSGKDYDYGYDEDDNYNSYEYFKTDNLGDTVFSKVYETSKLPKQNAASILHLDFKDKIKGYDGIYVLTVASKDHRWIQDTKVISISDIGLIVKEERDNIYVFANSIRTAQAISGAKVSFISTNNQKLYTATTDNEGVAVFNNISSHSPGFRVGLVTASMNDEFNFISLEKNGVETSRFDVGGRVPNATGLNAMIYAERNLYRPGETVNISTIIRNEQWGNPGEIPVKLKLIMPNGKEFATSRKILNEEGSCEASYNLPFTATTGTYVLQVYTGNDVLLNAYNVSVEDFMPDRIKAQLKINKPDYKDGDSIQTTIQADNLFGTPAAGRNYECQLNMDKESFSPKNYADYSFDVKNDFNFKTDFKQGKTNEKGSANEGFQLPAEIKNIGVLKGNIMLTVFDETGRPVHRYEHFNVYTQPIFIGMKQTEDYVSTRRPLRIPIVAVDKNGTPQNNTVVHVSYIKHEWNTVIQEESGHYRYVSQREEKVIRQENLRINGASNVLSFVPELGGEYEIRVSVNGSNSYISQTFYAWGWGDNQYSSFEVNNEGNVTIKPDKEKYNIGDDMNILLTTPFEGRMLVTVERDKVLRHYYVSTQNKSASITLKADDVCVPNVYITATLFRPMDGTDMPLTVAHGFKSVTVEDAATHLPVAVTVTEKSRSRTKQTITVKTSPGAYVTVAAVDEGILQVKNYETPDAYQYFYQKVALATNSYDIYPWLLPEIKSTRSSTGGDAADQSAMRVNPMFVNRVKNVSYWSGIQQADSRGIYKYEIDIPQFSGDLRVMAIAYKGKGFGGADQHMKVADPVIISTGLPRFLSPKDEVVMPVTLSNTTAKDATVTVTAKTNGPVSVSGSSTETIKIPANREQRVVFNIAAQQSIGAGKVTIAVKGMGETFINETDISIRPTASLQKMYSSGTVTETSNGNISPQCNFIPTTIRGKLVLSKSPLVAFSKNISYLVQYPYGCVEQTTSAVFPQLYYKDLVKSLYGLDDGNMNPGYNIQKAIAKLQSMQMSDGGLSYWPGGGYESWWGSTYACHFLLEAKKAGYEVNDNTTDKLLQYLKLRLNKRETEEYYYNGNQKKIIACKEIAYSLYVLALAGQSQISTMNYYKAHQDMLSLDSRYLLAAAYNYSGQPVQAKQVLPPAFSGEKSNSIFGGSFYSYVRDEAVALNALVDIDPHNPQIGTMAKQLTGEMHNNPYLNTQENVFAILAFGKIARGANNTTASATLFADGKTIGTTSGQDIKVDMRNYVNKNMQAKVKGKGRYYYYYELSGLTADGSYKQEDKYIKVRRTYYNRDGNPISNNTFRQNDLIIVRISISQEYSGQIDNIVITDMLPAGFEIENTRLNDMPDIKWIKNKAEADYEDIRDDRMNLFTSLGGQPKDFYYMVRAVSPGTYQLGPVQADAMYNGSYHSYNGAGIVTVLEK
ncbi:MAG: alpha-2-macroglobulin family protein [Bacteroidetes bacterium]|nr:alpha-2-macroglobulin family protein [Bacteroidota bacterium]